MRCKRPRRRCLVRRCRRYADDSIPDCVNDPVTACTSRPRPRFAGPSPKCPRTRTVATTRVPGTTFITGPRPTPCGCTKASRRRDPPLADHRGPTARPAGQPPTARASETRPAARSPVLSNTRPPSIDAPKSTSPPGRTVAPIDKPADPRPPEPAFGLIVPHAGPTTERATTTPTTRPGCATSTSSTGPPQPPCTDPRAAGATTPPPGEPRRSPAPARWACRTESGSTKSGAATRSPEPPR